MYSVLSLARRCAVLFAFCFSVTSLLAQNNNVNVNNGQQLAGVEIDAQGVLKAKLFRDPTGALRQARIQAAKEYLTEDLSRKSPLRKVSLKRLEAAVAARHAQGQAPTEPMNYLAGLTRITHVFYYPESREIVIAGPAEGFWKDLSGRGIGIHSGDSVLELRHLVTALRVFGPRARGENVVSVSIDSTQQGLQRMQQFLNNIAGRVRPNDANRIAQGLFEALGPQTVRVGGVSNRTHFAHVLVEADYRMKLIGIALEKPQARIKSYVERVSPRSLAKNALQRWYFVPNYECVRMSADGLAMQIEGEGVRLIGEDEMVQADGQIGQAGKANSASAAYVKEFTKEYPTLAKNSAVFGQLRDLIDLLVAAAFIKQQNFHDQAAWEMNHFGNERVYPTNTEPAIKNADPAVNVIWKGNVLMTPIGGGVLIEAHKALDSPNIISESDTDLTSTRESIKVDVLPANAWWWD